MRDENGKNQKKIELEEKYEHNEKIKRGKEREGLIKYKAENVASHHRKIWYKFPTLLV